MSYYKAVSKNRDIIMGNLPMWLKCNKCYHSIIPAIIYHCETCKLNNHLITSKLSTSIMLCYDTSGDNKYLSHSYKQCIH